MRNLMTFIIYFTFCITGIAQKLSFNSEFGNRISTSYFDAQLSGIIENPFYIASGGGNNDDYFKIYFSPAYQWGGALRYTPKKNLSGFEVGFYRSGYAAVASVDSRGFQRYGQYAYGNVVAKFHQLEIPVRFTFPIYLIRHPTQFKKNQKEGKKLKYLTGSIGIITSMLGNDFIKSKKRGRIDITDPNGDIQTMQYELRPASHHKVGFGLEFGVGYAWQLTKHLKFTVTSRAMLGITSMTTYEFVYLFSLGEEASNGVIQTKSDSINLNLGFSYDF
jgi:hypothetical protein